jgi:hypothetical protein
MTVQGPHYIVYWYNPAKAWKRCHQPVDNLYAVDLLIRQLEADGMSRVTYTKR